MSDDSRHEPELPDQTQLRDDLTPTTAPTLDMTPEGPARPPSRATGKWAVASRFDTVQPVGAGGMGTVAEVYDEILLRRVAMKTMHARLAGHPAHTHRFLEEVQITAQLDHPNIVPVHDVGFHDDGPPFFIMKRVMGQTLHDRIQATADQPLSSRGLAELLGVLVKVCDAIAFAHSRGVVHRDLKPANIMVGSHGQVYVMDWGIALLLDRDADTGRVGGRAITPDDPGAGAAAHDRGGELHLARSTASHRESGAPLMGTAAYMAPEQARAAIDDIDERTDVFGLGGVLYEILTGRPPYQADDAAVQLAMAREGRVQHPSRVTDRRLPPGLCRIATRALAARPKERYQSVAELADAVSAFLRGGGWFDTLELPPGAVIVSEGDDAEAAYIIDRGECEVYKTIDGARHVLRRLGPGDVFGETAVFSGKPRTASVVAATPVVVVAITRDSLDYELAEKPWLSVFVKSLAERFRDVDAALTDAITGHVPRLRPDRSGT